MGDKGIFYCSVFSGYKLLLVFDLEEVEICDGFRWSGGWCL